jgi:hypothetical protein
VFEGYNMPKRLRWQTIQMIYSLTLKSIKGAGDFGQYDVHVEVIP